MTKVLPLVALLVLIPSLLLNFYFLKNKSEENQHEVYKVTDGDTFNTKDYQTIRLIGVFAPELDACGGPQAKKALEKLIFGKKVEVDDILTDDYKRTIADVNLLDGQSVNLAMIKSGWAVYRSGASSKDHKAMQETSVLNRKQDKGIYGSLCTQKTNTKDPKCSIKGNVNQNGGKVYYTKNCEQYNTISIELYLKDQWFCSEKQAKEAGFTLGANCR